MQRFHRSTRFAAAEYLDTRPAAAHTGEEHLFDMPSATNLADFTRCPHRIFLDANGDGAEKLPPSPELQRLWEEGRAHETNIIATLDVAAVDRPTKAERIIQTLTLMRNGAELIYHGLLAVGDLVGEPDLLKKVAHETTLGSYGYVPVDVKNGRATKSTASATTKPAYAIQLCAYAELLETAQGWCPDTAFIVDQHGAWQTVDLAVFAPRYAEIRTRFVAIQAGVEPTIPGWKTACAQCAWQSHCLRVLHETDDLTTMAGIGEPKREKLFTIGIRTVADLAVADADEVMKVRGLGKSARFWPLRARAVKTGQPVLIEPWAPPVVDYELSYDVENTSAPFVYLHGLLVRKAGAKAFGQPGFAETDFGTFDPICAMHPETEAEVWRRFLEKVEAWTSQGTFVVYIYSPHERGVLRRLKRLYGGSEALERFEAAIIDLCKAVKRSVILPTDGDGLKTVAAQIDFHWRDKTPGGAQSITWWNEYWTDPERKIGLRDRVLAYNEDDVRATFAIRDWLGDFAKDANTTQPAGTPLRIPS